MIDPASRPRLRRLYDMGQRVFYVNIWCSTHSGGARFTGDPHLSAAQAANARLRMPSSYFAGYAVRVRMKVRP